MDKRERVMAALGGRPVDRTPFTMWRHFYAQDRTAQGLARATVDFYRHYNSDLIVMMPGPFYMAEAWGMDIRTFGNDEAAPYVVTATVGRATEWRLLPELDVGGSSLQREIDAVRIAKSMLRTQGAPLLFPLYSPLTTANMLCDGRVLDDLRSFSNDLRSGLGLIAAATIALGQACLDAGVDGFMLINRLASRNEMRPREYRDFVLEFDRQVLGALIPRAGVRILSLPGENLFFDQVGQYDVQAVNWETWRSDPSLASARRQVRCGLMGGLNPQTFVNGSVRDVRGQVADAVEQTNGRQLIIAPSGVLPADSRDELLLAVSEAVLSM
ncbi:MAG: hypothetical protein JW934_01070 [Anaerolineae bacterium]|nr:hypothetical protein [Anaerolineae bacterium]